MCKRFIDIVVAMIAIVVTSPLWVLAALGIMLTSPGPVFYRAQRVGLRGKVFTMHKFRTMTWQPQKQGSVVTAQKDARIFPFGAFLRRTKIDELPQFLDVLRGEMSIVGPRPEDPKIVEDHYKDWMRETLSIRPGITSPGALWGYTKMEHFLGGADPETAYVRNALPYKLALEYIYVRNGNCKYDLGLMWRTAVTVLRICMGHKNFEDQPEAKRIPEILGIIVTPGSAGG